MKKQIQNYTYFGHYYT